MRAGELLLVDMLEGAVGVVEVEEESVGVQLESFPDDGHQLVQVDLARLVDVNVHLQAVLLVVAVQQPY